MTGTSTEARSTRIRAALHKFLNQNSDREFTMADMMKELADLIEELQYEETNVYSFLHQMVKHDQINMRKAGHINLYSSKKRPGNAYNSTVATATDMVTTEPVAAPDQPPHLKLDIMKSTGNVRLEFGGLVIEIGVKP